MFKQAQNIVKIEGILAETDLKYGSFKSKTNNANVDTIGGIVKIRVDQDINGEPTTLEVPVHMFATKMTRKGTVNPAFTAIEKVMKEFVSIAASGNIDAATKVRITSGSVSMNDFVGRDGNIVSIPRISANFMSAVTRDFNPEATFSLEFMVAKMNRAVDKDGVELDPAKLIVEVVVPQYTAEGAAALNVDTLKLVACAPGVINAVESYWEPGRCYTADGKLNFTSRTEEYEANAGNSFGETRKITRTVSVNELIITGGSQAPMEEDYSWTPAEIKAGVAARKAKLEELKNAPKKTQSSVATPASKGPVDLGF